MEYIFRFGRIPSVQVQTHKKNQSVRLHLRKIKARTFQAVHSF